MEIPLIQTEFSELKGVAEGEGFKINLKADLSIKETKPFLKGEGPFRQYKISEIPHLIFNLNDLNGHTFKCEKCHITNINSNNEFESSVISKVNIVKGSIKESDSVEIFNILRCKKFGGSYLDEHTGQKINILDKISKNTKLISYSTDKIEDSNGILFHQAKLNDLENFNEKILPKFLSIFGFVTANFVGVPYQLIWKDSNNYIINLGYPKYSSDGGGIFYLEYPSIVENFINGAWPKWDDHIDNIELPVLIDYYILIENQKHLETKMLLCSVWMEAMKQYFAENIAGYHKNNSGFFLKSKSNNKYSFKELVQEVYTYFGVDSGDTTFVPYRNEVVHQGKINLAVDYKNNHFQLLICSIEKILLNLFNYKGQIWDRFNNIWISYQ